MKFLTQIKSLLVLTCALFSFAAQSQTVFLETFDEGDGSTAGTDEVGGVAWTSVCPACVAGDWFQEESGKLEAVDSNGPATWETTGDIDISGCAKFEISFELSEEGTMEACGTGCNSVDWVMLEYNIDGSGWVTPPDAVFCAGPCADVDVI